MNVLITGHCNASFIAPWVSELKKHYPNYKFSVLGLSNNDLEKKDKINALFNNIYQIPKREKIKKNRFKFIVSLLKNKTFLKQFFDISHQTQELINFYEQITKNQDIIFIHYVTPKNLEIVDHVPKNTKIILCFWGSDLMQASSENEWLTIKKYLIRADSITIQNFGMKLIFCCKYGWEYESKVKIAPFLVNKNILNLIDSTTKKNSREIIAKKFNADKDKIWISCGYRAVPMVQQDKIINALKELKKEDKSKLVFFISIGYGVKNNDYIESVLNILKTNGFNYVINNHFLSDYELAHLRKAMDIFIHFPKSDAMSLTLQEHLYAGNFVITNGNLPYSIFRKYHLDYNEVDTPDDILNLLQNKFSICKTENTKNRYKVLSMIEKEFTIENWINVIEN